MEYLDNVLRNMQASMNKDEEQLVVYAEKKSSLVAAISEGQRPHLTHTLPMQ